MKPFVQLTGYPACVEGAGNCITVNRERDAQAEERREERLREALESAGCTSTLGPLGAHWEADAGFPRKGLEMIPGV